MSYSKSHIKEDVMKPEKCSDSIELQYNSNVKYLCDSLEVLYFTITNRSLPYRDPHPNYSQ